MSVLNPSRMTLALTWTNGDPIVITLPPWELGELISGVRRLYRFPNFPWERHDLFVDLERLTVVCHYVENTHSNYNVGGRARTMAHEHLRKAAHKQLSQPGEYEVIDDKFQADFPALYEFLCVNIEEVVDGKAVLRERSKVQIQSEGGTWKACLMDAGRRASIFVTLKSPGEAFKALEKALQAERPDWRIWRNDKKSR